MIKSSVLASLSALIFAALVGCGGNVVVDLPGSGGGSGGGGGGSGGTTATTGTTTTTTVDPPSFCTNVCTTASQYGCIPGSSIAECSKGCEQYYDQYPDCAAEITALYQCAVDQLPQTGCSSDKACQKESDALGKCAGNTGTCGSDGCGGTGSDCFCTGQCNGSSLEVDCKSGANGSVQCACFVDGEQVATCNDVNLTCDVFSGCCAEFFPI